MLELRTGRSRWVGQHLIQKEIMVALAAPSLPSLSAPKSGPFLKAAQTKSLLQTPPKGPGANPPLSAYHASLSHQNNAKDRTLLAGVPQLVCAARKCKARLATSSAIYLRHIKERPGCEEYSARSVHPTDFPYQHDLAPTEIPTAASDPKLGETNRRVRIEPVPVPRLRGALQAATARSA